MTTTGVMCEDIIRLPAACGRLWVPFGIPAHQPHTWIAEGNPVIELSEFRPSDFIQFGINVL